VNDEAQAEDLTILAALEALERGIDAPGGPARSDETAEMMARLYTEALGLVPYELAPVVPAASVKARLMSLVRSEMTPAEMTPDVSGDETRPAPVPVSPIPVAAAEPVRAAAPAPAVPLRASQSQEMRIPPRMAAGAASRPVRPRRWPLALAAMFALAMLGLSLWLYSQVGAQNATIASLRGELSRERSRSEGAIAKVRQLENDGLDLREKFSLVTSPAVLVSPMRPVTKPGQPAVQPDARGVLFVAADHQHWYMTLRGLQPVPAGQAYKLWFVADTGAVSAGSFSAQPGAPVELSSQHMPAGTKGILVTLEADAQAPAPSGPEILRAAAVYEIS
jgi:hypothetical protein